MTEQSSFISHLIELRTRILRALLAVLIVFLCLFYFAQDLYAYLAEPLVATMPQGASMIATDVASPFLAPFKLTLVLSFFIAIPVVLYQIWGFVAPGLYRNEKKMVAPLLISSTLLFYAGMAFAYFVVFPLAFMFFNSVAPEGVLISTDISSYLNEAICHRRGVRSWDAADAARRHLANASCSPNVVIIWDWRDCWEFLYSA